MKKSKNYSQTDFMLDLYGLATTDEIKCVIANDDPKAIRGFRAAQLAQLEEQIECDDRD